MALIGWLLIVENGGIKPRNLSASYTIPATQALLEEPAEQSIQAVMIGEPLKQSVSADGWAYFLVTTPAHAAGVKIQLQDVDGDADLYVREGGVPEGSIAQGGFFDASSASPGRQSEEVHLADPGVREWYVAVHGVRASEFRLQAEIH